MTPTQRAAALRLIEFETLPRRLLDIACRVRVNECLFHDDEFVDDASHALKEASRAQGRRAWQQRSASPPANKAEAFALSRSHSSPMNCKKPSRKENSSASSHATGASI